MRLSWLASALVAASACGRGHEALTTIPAGHPSTPPSRVDPVDPPPRAAPGNSPIQCSIDPSFPSLWSLPEASAAAEVELSPGVHAIVALADSGHKGDAMLWTLPHGPLRPLRLTLDKSASDDIEGAAWADGHLYTLTSSGAVRRYAPSDPPGGLTLDRDAYPLGPPPLTCPRLRDGNCGNNYEGLCLRANVGAGCVGYAASKSKDALFCLTTIHDALTIDTSRPPLHLDLPPRALSDCAFGTGGGPAENVLVVTTNIYGGSHTYVVDEATGALSRIDIVGLPSNEAVAVDHLGAIYQFMDGDTSVSPAYRTVCHGWPVGR